MPHDATGSPGARTPSARSRSGLITAVAGLALFAWVAWTVGPREIWDAFQKVGWGIGWIVLLGGFRFATRAAAWTMCLEPPHRLPFGDAFLAVVCGDALGNVTPLGPIVGEPAKVACVRHRVPVGPAFTALAIENVLYTLSVAAMLAAGTIALLFSVTLSAELREFSEVTLLVIGAMFVAAAWILWSRPALLGGWLPGPIRRSAPVAARMEKLRALEQQIYTFTSRRRGVLAPLIAAEVAFHALGVAEAHITLWMILGAPPPLLTSFIIEATNRLITVAFKFIPFQVGVGQAGTGYFTNLLGLGAVSGITLSLVRTARMGVWSIVGMAFLVYFGLNTRRILEDRELTAR